MDYKMDYLIIGALVFGALIVGLMFTYWLKKDIRDTFSAFNTVFNDNLRSFSFGQSDQIKQLQDGLKNQFDTFSSGQERQGKQLFESMKDLQVLVNSELEKVRRDNDDKLEKIRKSVDEQLQSTLEKSFRQSFDRVRDQLDKVDKNLIEMQTLAKDVGGLKKILDNVKTRGNFGEVQLEAILDEIIPGRYAKQVMIKKGSQDRVDFTIPLPGNSADSPIVLPVDSKFPSEAFGRLQEARKEGDKNGQEQAAKELRNIVKNEAKSIHDKYIQVPETTAFAIMFLAAESIYAEVISDIELVNEIRRNYKITIVGPSTMVAFLNSLQMGFHTLQLQKSAGEIETVLMETKEQFIKFAEVLGKMRDHLDLTSNDLNLLMNTRTNKIIKALNRFDELQSANGNYQSDTAKECFIDK